LPSFAIYSPCEISLRYFPSTHRPATFSFVFPRNGPVLDLAPTCAWVPVLYVMGDWQQLFGDAHSLMRTWVPIIPCYGSWASWGWWYNTEPTRRKLTHISLLQIDLSLSPLSLL
jgi:hypothetical protein